MIIETQEDVTAAVLAGMQNTQDPRTRTLLEALVRHLHAFVREVALTEPEFQRAVAYVTALGHCTTPSHNETMLIAGTLGVSNLVCLLNNGAHGTRPTQANNLGPFWRAGAPAVENGGSLLRSPTPGTPLLFRGRVVDPNGAAIAGVKVDIWHASEQGFYENQDRDQAEMNLRGKFTTDADGGFSFRSVKPAGYPVPVHGPTGVLLAAQSRHNMRPGHLHALLFKPGFKTIASQIYASDDPYLTTDSQYGVTRALIADYAHHDQPAPELGFAAPWVSLDFTFTLEPGESRLPQPPISAKVGAPDAP